MKYPPFSWLRLGEEIKPFPSKIWFSFDKIPTFQGSAIVSIFITNAKVSFKDPYEAITRDDILTLGQKKVLELFLKSVKPSRNKNEFIVDADTFSKLLPHSSLIPCEILGLGVLDFAKEAAHISSFLEHDKNDALVINFKLCNESKKEIIEHKIYGDINAYAIDLKNKVYPIIPSLTPKEALGILNTSGLPLLGLYQQDSREMFYSLSRLGVDFSCLDDLAESPSFCQIVLRIILNTEQGKLSLRAHLVTKLSLNDFSDEVEIRAIGSIPTIHIAVNKNIDEEKFIAKLELPKLILRPHKEEEEARQFLFHLGASPARLHEGFLLEGDNALSLLKIISEPKKLPSYLKIDEQDRPRLIYLDTKVTLKLSTSSKETTSRIDISLSLGNDFDKTDTDFNELYKTKENLLVIDEDTLIISNNVVMDTLSYLSKMLGIERPNEYKNKSIAQIALIYNALKDRINIEASNKLLGLLDKFSLNEQKEDRKLPLALVSTLRPYQHDAVAWLSSINRAGLGGLLGDEMGLGKTLMVLTHLAKMKEKNKKLSPALVICPTSVIDVWQEEARIHLPKMKVLKWYGPQRKLSDEEMNNYDVIVTSYAILRRDIDGPLKTKAFSTLVLDEAQYIRNQQTDSFKAAKKINCFHKIALTGTPIENHLMDLFNILDCVEEGILGNRRTFEQQFGASIEQGSLVSSGNLKMLISPIVVRRKKSEVESELPEKIENVVHCKLNGEQRKLYNQFLNQMSGTILKGSAGKKDPEQNFYLLSALTRLRQICCHPGLLEEKQDSLLNSGKILVLKEIITECLEMNRKIIIYSQFLKMQEYIVELASILDKKGALWLHGSTNNRQEIIRDFQKDDGPRIIVVSLKAGGTGITLTAADTVIFADPWWNPAVEEQAIDRAHRIGQKKTVHVIRLISESSIEEEVVSLANRKSVAANIVLNEGFKPMYSLSKDEISSLLLREIDRLKEDKEPLDEIMD